MSTFDSSWELWSTLLRACKKIVLFRVCQDFSVWHRWALIILFWRGQKVSPGPLVPSVNEVNSLDFNPFCPLCCPIPQSTELFHPLLLDYLPLVFVWSTEYPMTVQFLKIDLFNGTLSPWSAMCSTGAWLWVCSPASCLLAGRLRRLDSILSLPQLSFDICELEIWVAYTQHVRSKDRMS